MSGAADTAQAGAERQVVLVSGMHRSGTSAFTRVCNLLGGALPHPLVEPAVGNELGHWEPAEVVAMNDRALLAAGGDVNSVFPVSPVWLQSEAAGRFVGGVEAFVSRLGGAPRTWFVKDPRIAMLAGLWREGVARTGVEPRVVIAFRNPWEVAASLAKRQLHHFPDEVWPLERGLALWLNYMLSIERQSRGLPRSFVGYERFLADWPSEIERIHRQLRLPQPVQDEEATAQIAAFLRPGERHARHEAMQTGPGLAMEVYAALHARCEDPDGGAELFDAAARRFEDAFGLLGGYVRALEANAAQIGGAKARAAQAETDAEASRRAAETSEMRVMHLMRAHSRPGGLEDQDEMAGLRTKHEALKAAYRTLAQALEAERARSATLLGGSETPQELVRAVADARAEIALLRRSRSWRITWPIRAASTLLRRR